MSIRLDRLESSTATIECMNLDDSSAKRLKSLGVFEGQEIELTKRGNPLIVKVAGSRVAIAKPIAAHILVRAD